MRARPLDYIPAHGMQRALTALVGVTFAVALAASLYLYAATASMDDAYQPGLGSFFSRIPPPHIIVLSVIGLPLAGTFISRIAAPASHVARTGTHIAAATIASVFVALVVIDVLQPCAAPVPATRELYSALRYSLLCPHLSNRSYALVLLTAVVTGLLLWASNWRRRRIGGPAAQDR